MKSTAELTNYAQFLRNAAPQAYDDFVSAFANYTAMTVQYLIITDGDVRLAQGQAQQCANILKLLEEVKNGGSKDNRR